MGDIGNMAGGAVRQEENEGGNDFDVIPPAWYTVEIEKAEVKETKARNGKYLNVTLSIIGEHYSGRKLFCRYNLENPNPKAVEIGRRELAALIQACGLLVVDDSSELTGHNVEVKVVVKSEEGHEPDNEVKGYRPVGGAARAAERGAGTPAQAAKKPVTPSAPAAPASSPAAKALPPWLRK